MSGGPPKTISLSTPTVELPSTFSTLFNDQKRWTLSWRNILSKVHVESFSLGIAPASGFGEYVLRTLLQKEPPAKPSSVCLGFEPRTQRWACHILSHHLLYLIRGIHQCIQGYIISSSMPSNRNSACPQDVDGTAGDVELQEAPRLAAVLQ